MSSSTSGAAIMKATDCCAEPWLTSWVPGCEYCQSCGQIVAKRANRTNDRERPKVVKEGKATTIDSF
jgi:hypothetical protein